MSEKKTHEEALLDYAERAVLALETIAYVLVVSEARQQHQGQDVIVGELLATHAALRSAGLTGE